MGCCGSSNKFDTPQDANAHKSIEQKMIEEQELEKRTLRILLLGPGDSGKTTILKQMRKIHHGKINPEELHGFISPIRDSIITYIVTLCKASVVFSTQHENMKETAISDSLIGLRNEFLEGNISDVMTEGVAEKCLTMWQDPGIQETLKYRSRFQLADNVPYFMDRLNALVQEDYLPSFEDYLRFRMRTTGYATEKFDETGDKGNGHIFEFTDVGGQRSERRKWLELVTDKIHGVLYIMAIAEYDMVLFEDEGTKRLDEALSLFKQVMEKGFFEKKSIVIFFNKYDLFEQKIVNVPITVAFDDFPGDNDAARDPRIVVDFLFSKFENMYRDFMGERAVAQLHFHTTTALDTDHIDRLLQDIQSDFIRAKLQRAGYI